MSNKFNIKGDEAMMKGLTMRLIPVLIMGGFAGVAGASGFALQNQTGSGNGNAFAGAAATAEDAGTIFFNPAGMTYLSEGHSVSLAGTVLRRTIDYKDTGSTTNAAPIPPLPVGSFIYAPTGDGGNAGGVALIPAGFWSYAVTPALRVGLGVSPTFGNETEYDENFRGFNSGFYASMEQVNINPSIAYKINEKVSVGAGINFAHNETQFKFGVPFAHPVGAAGLPAGTYTKVKGDDWGVGYNLGAMFQLSPSTRLGLSYRSTVKFTLEGEQTYTASSPTL
ncbi:MAG TPA: outer membrane protein transport protein, partial [Azospira sp.]|nr:outer membrane protein transport protein [Azospira sp.]